MTAKWTFRRSDRVIGGRPRGAEIRNRILPLLEGALPDAVLEIDFAGVETLDFSAADELVTSLVARVVSGELGSRRFYLTGLTEAVRESIDAVLKLKKRQCLGLHDGEVVVLGRLSSPHRETLAYINEVGEVTVARVAERFWSETNLTAATNRLNALAVAGLVNRVQQQGGRRGNRYVYQSIVPTGSRRLSRARQPSSEEDKPRPASRRRERSS